ncbi:hypothetical protein R1sor_013597 [Riccia sorocarpa]|uniref:Uncharacterized protein n=1 Tax=Riccia sorocarpa TaxID=122646 RepID=A0ABD3H709_9MARC
MASEQSYSMENEGLDEEFRAGDSESKISETAQAELYEGDKADESALKSDATSDPRGKAEYTADAASDENIKEEKNESASESGQDAGESGEGKETTGSFLQQAFVSVMTTVSTVSAPKPSVSENEVEADSILLQEAFSL